MKNVHKFPQLAQRYDKAGEWISKLDRGLSATDRNALQMWMAVDQENQNVLLELAELWDNMGELSRLSDLFPRGATRPATSPRLAFVAAASVLVSVLAGLWAATSLDPKATPVDRPAVVVEVSDVVYETAVGERSTVHLPDGTKVVLNTNSRIAVEYTKKYRLLRLARGEIHVQVSHDKDRPLSVISGDKIVQAVGTAFSLEITSDRRIELVVTEGKVLVGVQQSSSRATADVLHEIQESPSVVVAAGERLMLDDPEEEIAAVSPEEIEVRLSWRQGNLVFRGESLEDAVAEIERYTTVEFVILDDDLKKVRIAGLFRAGDVDGLLATLKENFDVAYERTSDGRILLTSL